MLISSIARGACDAETLNEAVANNDEATVRACTESVAMGAIEVSCSNAYNQCLQNASNTAAGASDCVMQYRACDRPAHNPDHHDPNATAYGFPEGTSSVDFNETWTDYPN